MKCKQILFERTGFFSKTVIDYLNKNPRIQPFYHHFPNLDGFAAQIQEKKSSFDPVSRKVLVDVLHDQYNTIDASEKTIANLHAIQNQQTFTVTTGHQLNLFTGPLYFLYKIVTTINLSQMLAHQFPAHYFVPVYWMATEDHDFEEINHFNFKEKKVVWDRPLGGAVGRFSLDGLDDVFTEFSAQLGTSKNESFLKELFQKTYLEHNTLSEATRYLVNELFKDYGLVILDGDDQRLKDLFAPIMKDELVHQTSFNAVSITNAKLKNNYKIQVTPRRINLFYLTENSRDRIVEENGVYQVLNTDRIFSKTEILKELEDHSHRFSPNVLLRPAYQEVILPNLCYVGGGGELGYWLQLKAYFEAQKISFPILLLRNSVQILSRKQSTKLVNLKISHEELFMKKELLIKKKVRENSSIRYDFLKASEVLNQQFSALKRIASQTDVSFMGAVSAQERKQLKGLKNLEKRLLRAEKRRYSDLVLRIHTLQDALFPNQGLEERRRNFSEYYATYGADFIPILKEVLLPFRQFNVLEL